MLKEMIGFDNGYFKVLDFDGYTEKDKENKKRRKWKCQCNCGNIITLTTTQINQKIPRSCGCYKPQGVGNRTNHTYLIKHGLASRGKKHPIYKLWERIRNRCYTTNFPRDKKNYRDKGIILCDEWANNPQSFYNWCLENGWKSGLSIDRINNDGNYEPSNCQFISVSENSKKLFKDRPDLNRGENNKNSSITEDQAREIKTLFSKQNSCKSISKLLNISYNIVYHVIKNNTWKHVKVQNLTQ